MTAGVATARERSTVEVARAWMRDRPLVPLFLLLGLLVLVLQVVQPGIVTPNWVSATLRFAIPLAIIAACQTLTMLTGGIDLSYPDQPVASPFLLHSHLDAGLVRRAGDVDEVDIRIVRGICEKNDASSAGTF